jgi:hypothetical protein
MAFSWPLARHARWQKQLDAYIDGELSADGVRRLDAHLAGCSGCANEVAERRELKRMAAALPQMPAPRSFRITPGMLAEAPVTKPTAGRPVVMRLGQVTAGLAMVAFAGVLAADLAQSDENGTGQQQASGDSAQPMSDGGEAERFVTVTVSALADDMGDDDSSGELPSVDDGPAGAGAVEPTPNATDSMYESSGGGQTPTAPEPAARDREDGNQPPGEGRTSSIDVEAAGEDDEGISGFVIAEVALLGVAMVGAVTWLTSRRGRSV